MNIYLIKEYSFTEKVVCHSLLLLVLFLSNFVVVAARLQSKDCTSRVDNSIGDVEPHVVVAIDGSGQFTKVQDAIDAAPVGRLKPYIIYIKNGVYKEVIRVPAEKTHICLRGQNWDETILTYDNYAKRLNGRGLEFGTSGSASTFVYGDFFVAENLTFQNTSGVNAGQALAININAPHAAFQHCRFLGHQDTWYAGNGTKQYLKNCYVAGSVDFVFGGSAAYFEQCELHSTRAGYITAASTAVDQDYGYVFDRCHLSADASVKAESVYLGRPWRPYAKVVYLSCTMDGHIKVRAGITGEKQRMKRLRIMRNMNL